MRVVDIRFSYVTRPFNSISSVKSGERACHERRMVRGLHSLVSREISDARRSFYDANQSRLAFLACAFADVNRREIDHR